MATMIKSITVVGLGKLGLCIAAVLADAGFKVVGVDVDEGRVRAVNSGEVYIKEPKLPHLIRKNRKRIRATTALDDAIASSQATFVILPTPSEPDGTFSLKHVLPVVKEAARAISRKDEYHLMVINSTIMPGSMDNYIKPTLEEHSGKLVGNGVGLCYNPEFVALGDVINGLTRPDRRINPIHCNIYKLGETSYDHQF
ncbi:MAG: 3-hydroxyacyl-CoA dehydrogenase NAD-binding domain-containing protein [Aigarchaeota archaeon]|nr:3-hydroxyacyl-CoA dehydrogenase NAD-binding domain-containing protein [Candidatus Calditenuis fumarioli]